MPSIPIGKDFEKRSDGTERRWTRDAGGDGGGWAGGAEMARGRAAGIDGTIHRPACPPPSYPRFPARTTPPARIPTHAPARARSVPPILPKILSWPPLTRSPLGAYVPGVPGARCPARKGERMELSEYFAKGLAAKHVMRMFHTRPCIRATEYDRTESRLVDLDVVHVRFDLNGQPFEVTIVLTPDGRAVLCEL